MNLALFDLDNTLLSGDSDYEWMQYLISLGAVDGETYQARNLRFYEEYQAGTLDIYAFLDFQLKPLTEHPRRQLETWRQAFVLERIRPLIGHGARNLIRDHLQGGDLCALVTATNAFVTGPICRELGLHHLIATVPAQEDGKFTGHPRGTPAFREGKIERVEAWLEMLGLAWCNFDRTWFYSDSQNDLPLMQKVSDPVAVRPDPVLRAHAETQGWPIIDLAHGTVTT